MTTSLEMVLIAGIVEALKQSGSWCGETHVQKTSYIAKILEGVPLDAEFILYKHGPFSFDLNKSLNHMRSRGLLALSPREGYGPSYSVNLPMWRALDQATGKQYAKYSRGIRRICSKLGNRNVSELERVSTAVYISENYQGLQRAARIGRLTKLKPPIPSELAAAAFAEAQELADESRAP